MHDALLLLHAEDISVSKRQHHALVRVAVATGTRDQQVEHHLEHARVDIERVPIGTVVDAVPPIRQEGDTIILSVVEERLVVERRLVLTEEVRIRRVCGTEHVHQTVVCREQHATITRTPTGEPYRSEP